MLALAHELGVVGLDRGAEVPRVAWDESFAGGTQTANTYFILVQPEQTASHFRRNSKQLQI